MGTLYIKRFWLVLLILLLSSWQSWAQHRSFRVLTYNVENLFDTCHDARFDDFDFLPESPRQWNSWRYWKKQGALSRTLVAASGPSPIDLIGLCEVENDTVVRDLTKRTKLYRMGYEYIITHSKDVRGVDVALLYQPERFKVLSDSALRVPYNHKYGRPTRDILYVSGRLPNGDTLDVFVNHWPSRRGGAKQTEFYRWEVGRMLRNFADSLLAIREHPNCIFMGDFNDEYLDPSVSDGLGAVEKENARGDYVVLSANLRENLGVRGTYKYRGIWNQLDQIIVSRSLLEERNKLRVRTGKCKILVFPFLVESDETRGGIKPKRTYLGPVFKGGVSDHLPLLLELEW